MNDLRLPTDNYSTGGLLKFGDKIKRKLILWATHLGDDVAVAAGTPVKAIGDGKVVFSETRPGTLERKNWGGVVIVKHHDNNSKNFYSLYGHLSDLRVRVGDQVQLGQQLGAVAAGNTPENGYWQEPHLHFAIYTGPWRDEVLPGYWRPDAWLLSWLTKRAKTKLAWWEDPQKFILAADVSGDRNNQG